MRTNKRKSSVSKVTPATSDTTQKGVKLVRNYVFQIYSSTDPKWKGVLPTPTLLRSNQNKWKGILSNPPRANQRFTRAKPRSKQTFQNSNVKSFKSYPPRTNFKSNTPHKPLTKHNVRFNDKPFFCKCQCNCQRFLSHVKSNQSQKSHTFQKTRKNPNLNKHPGLGLKNDKRPVHATSYHASFKNTSIVPSSKLVWMHKLTV